MKVSLISSVLAVTLSLSLALASAGVTATPTYPPRAATLQVSTSSVARGANVRATARGFRPGSLVGFRLGRTASARGYWLGQARADRRGAVSKRLRIPTRVAPGRWLLVATGRTPDSRLVRLPAVLRVR